MLSNTADAALELPRGGQRMEQLNSVSPGVVVWDCLDLLLILYLEESSCGSVGEEWPDVQLHCLVTNGIVPLSL